MSASAKISRDWRKQARRQTLQDPPTRIVSPQSGVHGQLNQTHICYSGEETVLQDLADSEIRAKALEALDDMEDRFNEDFPDRGPKKYLPGAMGCQLVGPISPEGVYKIYYHSSMRQETPGSQIVFADNFQEVMNDDDGNLPPHRRDYRCTEPGLFTNSESDFPGSGAGSRIYFVDIDGQFRPPYSPNPGLKDDGKIGCAHIVAIFQAATTQDGPASTKTSAGTAYWWYNPPISPQYRTPISREIFPRTASSIAGKIADEIVESITRPVAATLGSNTAPGTLPSDDLQLRATIRAIAYDLTKAISHEIHLQFAPVTSRETEPRASSKMSKPLRRLPMSHRVPFATAYQKAKYAATEAAAQLSHQTARETLSKETPTGTAPTPKIDEQTISEITSKVVTQVTSWAAGQLTTRPVIRPMTMITQSSNPRPSMTPAQLQAWLSRRNALRTVEAERRRNQRGQAADAAPALPVDEMEELE